MEEKTLLICLEEGIEEYDDKLLKSNNTEMVVIDEEIDFTVAKLVEFDKQYNPERILIEYNGMWDIKKLVLPDNWEIAQQITIVDATTFDTYFNNMRSLFADMIRSSELLIMNRCKDIEKLKGYKRSIMAINTNIDVVFEDENGEVEIPITDEDLPYDLKADLIEISDDNYGIFYLDMWQRLESYENKKFKIKTLVMKEPSLPKNFFVAGRPAMNCCADDMVFMGIICKSKEAKNLDNKDTVEIVATIVKEYRNDYGCEGPVLYADSVTMLAPMKDPVVKMF